MNKESYVCLNACPPNNYHDDYNGRYLVLILSFSRTRPGTLLIAYMIILVSAVKSSQLMVAISVVMKITRVTSGDGTMKISSVSISIMVLRGLVLRLIGGLAHGLDDSNHNACRSSTRGNIHCIDKSGSSFHVVLVCLGNHCCLRESCIKQQHGSCQQNPSLGLLPYFHMFLQPHNFIIHEQRHL